MSFGLGQYFDLFLWDSAMFSLSSWLTLPDVDHSWHDPAASLLVDQLLLLSASACSCQPALKIESASQASPWVALIRNIGNKPCGVSVPVWPLYICRLAVFLNATQGRSANVVIRDLVRVQRVAFNSADFLQTDIGITFVALIEIQITIPTIQKLITPSTRGEVNWEIKLKCCKLHGTLCTIFTGLVHIVLHALHLVSLASLSKLTSTAYFLACDI